MVVGICKLALYLPGCQSLKDKRAVLRRIKDKFFSRFKILLSEVKDQDLWQRSEIGFAIVGSDKRLIESLIDKSVEFIESNGSVQMLDRAVEFINY